TVKKDRARSINRIRALLAGQGVAVKMGSGRLLESLESIRIWDGSPLPSGLLRRLESEIAQHSFLHRQLLQLESQRNARIRNGQDHASKIARHLMTLRSVGEVSASTLSEELSWRGLKNRRQVGSLIGLAPSAYQSGESSKETGISRAGNRHV